jgi:hypothetical protein
MEALHKAADLKPDDPQGHQLVAYYYWEKSYKDPTLPNARKKEYILNGIEATDRALALNPDYIEAITYKGILMQMQAGLESDLPKRNELMKEAKALQQRAIELTKQKTAGTGK